MSLYAVALQFTFGGSNLFQHYNAHVHKAKKEKELNLTEHLWDELEHRCLHPTSSVSDLSNALITQ